MERDLQIEYTGEAPIRPVFIRIYTTPFNQAKFGKPVYREIFTPSQEKYSHRIANLNIRSVSSWNTITLIFNLQVSLLKSRANYQRNDLEVYITFLRRFKSQNLEVKKIIHCEINWEQTVDFVKFYCKTMMQ